MVNISTAPHKPYQFKNRAILQGMAPIFFPGQNLPVTFDHHRRGLQAKLAEIIRHPDSGGDLHRFAVTENLHLLRLIFRAQQEPDYLVCLVVGGNPDPGRHKSLSRPGSAELIADKIDTGVQPPGSNRIVLAITGEP